MILSPSFNPLFAIVSPLSRAYSVGEQNSGLRHLFKIYLKFSYVAVDDKGVDDGTNTTLRKKNPPVTITRRLSRRMRVSPGVVGQVFDYGELRVLLLGDAV
ncbi:hypothetical protein DMH17_17165 [Raoultella planticola]|nr:hypothetical protein [Raoultella planticola]